MVILWPSSHFIHPRHPDQVLQLLQVLWWIPQPALVPDPGDSLVNVGHPKNGSLGFRHAPSISFIPSWTVCLGHLSVQAARRIWEIYGNLGLPPKKNPRNSSRPCWPSVRASACCTKRLRQDLHQQFQRQILWAGHKFWSSTWRIWHSRLPKRQETPIKTRIYKVRSSPVLRLLGQ